MNNYQRYDIQKHDECKNECQMMDASNINLIISFINTNPRNRLIVLRNMQENDFSFTDIGFELSNAIENNTTHKQISMLASEALEKIIQSSEKSHAIIGKYIAIRNIGILMEDSLKINILSFLIVHSQNHALILDWDGEIDQSVLYFLSKKSGKVINLKGISHIVV